MISINTTGSYTEIYIGGGNFITQAAPTNFHQFWTRKILVGDEKPEDFREVTPAEKARLEASDAAWVRPPQEFIDRFKARARGFGDFNEETGYFELNEIYDIGYDEALKIDADSFPGCVGRMPLNFYSHSYPRGRTLLPSRGFGQNNGTEMFGWCNSLVHVRILDGYTDTMAIFSDITRMFMECNRLKKVLGILHLNGANATDAFSGCRELEEIDLKINHPNLKSIDLHWSPKLSLRSLERMVELKEFTNNVPIMLHPTAYARLTDELIAKAAEKQITFVTT